MQQANQTTEQPESGQPPQRRRVLELRDVTFGSRPDTSLCVRNQSLSVHSGDLVLIRATASQNTRPFTSMMQGLVPPTQGSVLFSGRDWARQHARTQFRMRSRIGRVFDQQAWVANLNVRENLLLAKQHFRADLNAIEEELKFWAKWFQLDGVSRIRPASLENSLLQIHQWIRAFLGGPTLLLLERPMRFVSANRFPNFLESIQYLQERGTAVIWIAGNTLGDNLKSISATNLLDLRPEGKSNRDTDTAESDHE